MLAWSEHIPDEGPFTRGCARLREVRTRGDLVTFRARTQGLSNSGPARSELPPYGLVVGKSVRLPQFLVTRSPARPIVETSDRLENPLLLPFVQSTFPEIPKCRLMKEGSSECLLL